MNETIVTNLRCEYRTDPLGIDERQPRLSWQLFTDRRGARQTAYQIQAALTEGDLTGGLNLVWDTGKVLSNQSHLLVYNGGGVVSARRIWWRVRVWDEVGERTDWSTPAWWELGLLERSDWKAKWIGASLVGGPRTTIPCPYLRKDFVLGGDVVRARLYITALGLYEAYLNGQRVGDDLLAPGWSDYRKRVRYQVYDVSRLLANGENAIGVILGDGWYCGHLGWDNRQQYGLAPKLLAQLAVQLSDGKEVILTTDETWKTGYGPLLEADLLMGESYDARREFSEWDRAGFVDKGWSPVEVFHDESIALDATNGPTVQRIQELPPVADPFEIKGHPQSCWVFDFGQNMVGWVRLRVKGEPGTTIILQYGEILKPDGTVYTENLRSAHQTDVYTLRGGDEELYEPRFTFHGFRYVELRGYPGIPERGLLTGVVIHSNIQQSGEFSCSNTLLNQLQHNILWGQKGNFVDVPTDCPQRDERLGWTGDGQVFIRTATFNLDVAGFYTKWQGDLADAQLPSGAIPSVAPVTASTASDGGPAWADAVVICPWTIYQCYGDARLLERHYPVLTRFMDFLVATSPGLIRADPEVGSSGIDRLHEYFGYGDWLALDGPGGVQGGTHKGLIGTAFLAHDASLMSKIASILGKSVDADRYDRLFNDTRRAFQARYVTAHGLLVGQTQTACVLALMFDLLPEDLRPGVLQALIADIERRGMHLSTGFVGTPYLLHVLSQAGRYDIAYDLLTQTSYPSWLFPVTQGATTIWERWDGWTPQQGFQDPGMNSFNHYAFGSVGAWMVKMIGGLDLDPAHPGFKHVVLRPVPGGGLEGARLSYLSPYGLIISEWRLDQGDFHWNVCIPANSTARIIVPVKSGGEVLESGSPAVASAGISLVGSEPGCVIFEIGAGEYAFAAPLATPGNYTVDRSHSS